MGSAASPSKNAPSKRAGSSKPNRPRPRGGAKAGKGSAAAAAVAAGPHRSLPPRAVPADLPVCVVDNGGWSVKYGLVPPPSAPSTVVAGSVGAADDRSDDGARDRGEGGRSDDAPVRPCSSMHNATARPPHQLAVLAGDEIASRMKNLGQLTWNYPLERGMVSDGEAQLRVWARVLEAAGVTPAPAIGTGVGGGAGGFLATIAAARRGKVPVAAGSASVADGRALSSADCAFLLLEPPFVPSVISEAVDCILFRELGMARVARVLGPCMAAEKYLSSGKPMDYDVHAINSNPPDGGWINDGTECCCVVDSGHSFTHVVPTFRGEALTRAIRRLDVGGKILTNLLKEAVTYRQWNMMDEFHVVNDAKERLCFVSDRFDEEMGAARGVRKGLRWFDREYLLPDFVSSFEGSVRLPEPLQRKREAEEMETMKREVDRLKDERQRRELEDEARDLTKMEMEGEEAVTSESNNESTDKQQDRKNKSNKRRRRRKSKEQRKVEDVSDDDKEGDSADSENDSDEETGRQRLQRLRKMREEERRRRERESLDRQALALSVERFAVPEVIFRPSDMGLDRGGVAEAIVEAVGACDPSLRAAMYHNVLLVGGNARIPGYGKRVEEELRALAPANYPVRVHLPEDPVSYAWQGAKQFSSKPGFLEQFSIDRLSWEAAKKSGKNQGDIWGTKMMCARTKHPR
ncbi:hypothetical protein ACHAWF_007473 [Thalassiosira exigua]